MRHDGDWKVFTKAEGIFEKKQGRVRRLYQIGLLSLALLTLSACAGHKDLTAPCDASDSSGLFGWLEASGRAFACQPLRRITAVDAEAVNGVH